MIEAGEFPVANASQASSILAQHLRNAIEFLKENDKEYKVVQYEELLKDKYQVIKECCDFIGRGDYLYGVKIIDKKLNREVARNDLGDISELEKVVQLIINSKL